jgi:hypothetical protein
MRRLCALSVLLVGCNDVLGFEERTFDPCVEYCDLMETTCTQTNAEYQDEAACLATCALLEPGNVANPVGNTVACRVDAVKRAKETQAFEELCPAAGPGGFNGSGEQVCGDRCSTYCELMAEVCGGLSDVAALDLESCLTLCSNVPDNPAYDPTNGDVKDHDNSIQCRFWHLGVGTTAPNPHCAHADGTTKCDGVFPTSSSTGTGP